MSRTEPRDGIREDGTVEGYVVETHHLPLESASIDEGGFFRFVGDGGPINYEIRVPVGPIKSAILALHDASSAEGSDGLIPQPTAHSNTAGGATTQPDAVEALRACEEVLRLIHEAAGPVDKGAPMPNHSTFEAWKMAEEVLRALTTDEEGA